MKFQFIVPVWIFFRICKKYNFKNKKKGFFLSEKVFDTQVEYNPKHTQENISAIKVFFVLMGNEIPNKSFTF